jgi:hypothetical protein
MFFKWILLGGLLLILSYLFSCYFLDGWRSFEKMDRETVENLLVGLPSPNGQCYANVLNASVGKDPNSQLMVTCKIPSSSVTVIGCGLRAFQGTPEQVKVEWKSDDVLSVTYPKSLKVQHILDDTKAGFFNKVITIEYNEVSDQH